ncbi:hypothetical protein V6N13_098068 [Hibiscus sabdariffa]
MDSPQGSTLTTNMARLFDGSTARSEVSHFDCLPVYVKELIAGGGGGAFAKTTVAPLERIKILLQYLQSFIDNRFRNSMFYLEILLLLLLRLHLLCNLSLLFLHGILPYAGFKFYVYEVRKTRVPEEQQKSIVMHLSCAAAAGLLGQTLTYPLDIVTRQMHVESLQCSTIQGCSTRYRNTLDGLTSIARNQGLFAGLSINYMKMVPSMAVGFTAYDMMKVWLRIPPHRKSGAVFSG